MIPDGDGGVLLIPGGRRMVVRHTESDIVKYDSYSHAQRRAAAPGKTFDTTGTELTRTKDSIRASRRGPIKKRC